MCNGGRLIADFVAGTAVRPDLPAELEDQLTLTVDGLWVIWAHKVARKAADNQFIPMRGGSGYPADAKAECRALGGHDAPDPGCRCGFHALSSSKLPGLPVSLVFTPLTVALSGRVLAFEWAGGGVLWRAARQTVVRVERPALVAWTEGPFGPRRYPDDPDGRLAVVSATTPHDSGPVRLKLPASPPVVPVCDDDAGWCMGDSTPEHAPATLVLA